MVLETSKVDFLELFEDLLQGTVYAEVARVQATQCGTAGAVNWAYDTPGLTMAGATELTIGRLQASVLTWEAVASRMF